MFDGPAYVQSRTGVPIVPVGIGGTEAVMPKGSKIIRPHKVVVVIGEPLPAPEVAGLEGPPKLGQGADGPPRRGDSAAVRPGPGAGGDAESLVRSRAERRGDPWIRRRDARRSLAKTTLATPTGD